MITPEYCRKMAAYNAWQNSELSAIVNVMDEGDLRAEQGAFFGSIWGTLNHLMWGDRLWIARFDGGEGIDVVASQSADWLASADDWATQRLALDDRITHWASKVKDSELSGNLTWHSTAMNCDFTKEKALCVMQMFNHQTHHRGQVHAMLTRLGIKTQVTDLPFTPEV